MAKILAIIRQDLLVFLSDRSNLPNLLITPVVMTLIIGLVDGGAFGGPAIRRLDVIDQDNSPASGQFLAMVRQANPGLTLCPMDNTDKDPCSLGKGGSLSESQALERVANTTSLALLQIPSGFGAGLASQQHTAVTFRSTSSIGTAQSAQQAVQAALSQINGASVAARVGLNVVDKLQAQTLAGEQAVQMESALYQRALEMGKTQNVQVEFSLSGSPQKPSMGESLRYGLGNSVPGMGVMFALMNIFGAMAALIEERRQWTLQRLAMMPVTRGALLAGKILMRFSLGLLQFLIVLVIGAALGMNFGKDPLALVLLAVLYCLSITALTFAIGPALKNPAQASGLGLLLTMTLSPLGGAWWPMDISPRFMQVIGHVSPIAWAMDGFTALTYRGAQLADIWLPVVVLAGMTVVLFLIALPRFRYQVE